MWCRAMASLLRVGADLYGCDHVPEFIDVVNGYDLPVSASALTSEYTKLL